MTRLFMLFLLSFFPFSCAQNESGHKEAENKGPIKSESLKAQIEKLTTDTNHGSGYIDIYVYEKGTTSFVFIQISETCYSRYQGTMAHYSDDYIINYGGLNDSVAEKFLDLKNFSTIDSLCEDYSEWMITEPCIFHFYKEEGDLLNEYEPTEEDLLFFDSIYFSKFGEHAYSKEKPIPYP